MSDIEKWRAYVEAHKFTGPTVKLLRLGDTDQWAVMDHEYNLIDIETAFGLGYLVPSIQHPPQRERPKPQLYSYDFETKKATPIPDLNIGDLDL